LAIDDERAIPHKSVAMDPWDERPVSWEQILGYAQSLEAAAERNDVRAEDGARLVLLVLKFQKTVVAGSLVQGKPNGRPIATP
jgi:hypothetical protein